MKLSKKTRSFFENLQEDNETYNHLGLSDFGDAKDLSQADIVKWLNKNPDAVCKENRFDVESLRASLLKDLYRSFLEESEVQAFKKSKKNSLSAKMQLGLLAVAGTTVAACEGFDGITSMLGIFSGIPGPVVFGAGIAFSLLSITVFYGFDLVEISKNIGVRLKYARQMLDVYLDQVESIKLIRKKIIASSLEKDQTIDEIESSLSMLTMLRERFDGLAPAREEYQRALNTNKLKFMKNATALLTGVLFFGGGFFAGQNLALAVAALVVAPVAASFFPVLLTSALIGLASFCIYWFLERPGLQNLVGRWFGLDKDKVDALASPEAVQSETKKFDQVEKILTLKKNQAAQKVVSNDCEAVSTSKPGPPVTRTKANRFFSHTSEPATSYNAGDLLTVNDKAPEQSLATRALGLA